MSEKKLSPDRAKKEFQHLSEDLDRNLPEIADLISRVAEKMELATGKSLDHYNELISSIDTNDAFSESPDVQQALGEVQDVLQQRRRNVHGADAWPNPFHH